MLLLWAALGVVGAVGLTLWDLGRTTDTLGGLVVARPDQASATLLESELGPSGVRAGGGHDGAFFYAIARDPWHPRADEPYLDAPRYRFQRIVFPVLAWIGHPTGGGDGLVGSLFAVGVLGLALGAVGMGALSVTLRGPPWVAVLFPLMIGSFLSLRLSVADPLAVAFALWALVFALRRHLGWAVVAAILAVLTKETSVLIFAGFLVYRRDRRGLVLLVVPAAVGLAWAAVLRVLIESAGSGTANFDWPLLGVYRSIDFWRTYDEPLGWLSVGLALLLGVVALVRRGIWHPLGGAVALQLALIAVVSTSVLAPERNGSRTVLPLTVLAIVMLATPKAPTNPWKRARGSISSAGTQAAAR